jgi:esterase/lipase
MRLASRRRSRLLLPIFVLLAVAMLGPRAHLQEDDARRILAPLPTDLAALPAWLAASERAAGVLDTAVAARVVFAGGGATPVRTAWSVVYLHGFSATRQETAPLAEDVARQLGANLFEARLRGHGLPGDSLGHVTAADWVRDTRRALDIGRKLGDSVLVIGTSTGGTLGVWLATLPAAQRVGLHTLVLISPNFGPRDKAAAVLTWPWAAQLLPRVIPYREWTPRNEEQARFWTVRYPSRALFPMQALVEQVRDRPLVGYDVPTLVLYNPDDQVVDAVRTETWLAAVAAASPVRLEQVRVTPVSGEDGHVIAGRVVAPSQTASLRDRIVQFVQRH